MKKFCVWLMPLLVLACLALPCSLVSQEIKGPLDSERLERIEKLLEIRDFKRLEEIALNQQRALEVIREELAQLRKERDKTEQALNAVSALRSEIIKLAEQVAAVPGKIRPVDLGSLGVRLGELADAVMPLPGVLQTVKELVASVPEVLSREFSPVRSALEAIGNRLDQNAVEYEAARKGLLAAFAEARAELVKARADAQQKYAEAEKLRAETEKQLLEARGTLGQRLLWFTVCLVGSLLILLFGLAIIIAVLSRLGSKIASVLSIVKVP